MLNEGLETLGTNEYPDGDGGWCGVFEGSALERVDLPSTLRRIEYNVFYDCQCLRNIDLPEGLEFIGQYSFSGAGLERVEFPASLRTVAQEAFAQCESLRTAKFSEGLEVLGTDESAPDGTLFHGVFEESALEDVQLPSTLRRIEYSAF